MIKVLVVDDHELMREGLLALLRDRPQVRAVGECADGRTAVKLAARLAPDVVVMDVGMPGMNGVEACRQITAASDKVKVLALSMRADEKYVLRMCDAGASGYVLKESAFEELDEAIRCVARGGLYLSRRLGTVAVRGSVSLDPPARAAGCPGLTAREREVLQLIAEGNSTRSMAEQLDVSVKTVEAHRGHIMKKLDLHSVAELTKYAVREGLTDLEH